MVSTWYQKKKIEIKRKKNKQKEEEITKGTPHGM